jgi:hypothetical protein
MMKAKSWIGAWVCLALVSAPALAQGEADEAAMMEAFEKAGTPGPHHEAMARLAGKWNATMTMWEQPGAKPSSYEGTMTNKMVMGGRYMEQIFDGEVMGQPMSGRGIAAFDNVTGKHTGVWYDSLSTQITYSEGECNKDHTVETAYLKTHDPMGNEVNAKLVTRVVSNDEHVFEYYMLLPDGGEFKTMEIVYKRA